MRSTFQQASFLISLSKFKQFLIEIKSPFPPVLCPIVATMWQHYFLHFQSFILPFAIQDPNHVAGPPLALL